VLVSATICVVTAVLLPFGSTQLGPSVSFLPAVLAAVTCFDIISVYLLAGDYRDTGDRRILVTAWAYVCSLVLMSGYALAFPGVVSPDPPLATAASVAPYLYIGWHVGFPVLLGLAWAPWPSRLSRSTAGPARQRELWVSMGVVASASASVVAACVLFVDSWPVLIDGLDLSGMLVVTGPVAFPLVVTSLVLTWRGLRGRTGPERWAAVAVLVCLCDLALTYGTLYRFSLGWYAGRSLTVVSAAVLLVAMLAAFRQLKSAAEYNAAFDSLTGLANRRTAHAGLGAAVARARRAGTPLTVIALDLDHFKTVNDRHGHPAGDAVLAAVGAALIAGVRDGDVPARVGGEEFIVLLPDIAEPSAMLVAERLRTVVSALQVPGVRQPVTASLGVAHLDPWDLDASSLLRRADEALYEAKDLGRDRVVTAAPPIDSLRI
jgi:diguanylate cyclase (GGDEF)-like protein